jgi:hypothetical protein
MTERNEHRRVLETAKQISRMPIDPDAARRAVADVRFRLNPPRPQRRHLLWIMSASIAAVVLLSIALMVSSPRSASAAEQLRAAAETTRNYRGWVHVKPAADTKAGATNALVLKGLHMNTANGTTAIAFEIFQALCIKMVVPSQKQELMYSALTNQLRIDSAPDDLAAAAMKRSAELPLKLAELLADFKSRGLKQPQVMQSIDGDLQRFELTSKDDPQTLPEELRDLAAGKMVVWCDPQTKLIRRMQTQVDGKPTVLEYAYGDPEIRDIYDLGVPRTVKLLDGREPATAAARPRIFDEPDITRLTKDAAFDLKALEARIQKRILADFGDYVIVECEELKALRHSNRQGSIDIRARQGNMGLRAHYLVAPAMMFFGGPGFPRGWPTPTLDDTLATLRPTVPIQLYAYDGKLMWENDQNNQGKYTSKGAPPSFAPVYFSLGREFWQIQGFGPSFDKNTITVLRDANRPGLIVVHVEATSPVRFYNSKNDRKIDSMYWLDPARDDLMVEWIQRSDDYGTGKLDSLIHRVYLDFAQLADGRWYTTHWQQRTAAPREPGVTDDGAYHEGHRQFFQNAKLPADWFGDPNERLKSAWKLTFPPATTTTAPTTPTTQPPK